MKTAKVPTRQSVGRLGESSAAGTWPAVVLALTALWPAPPPSAADPPRPHAADADRKAEEPRILEARSIETRPRPAGFVGFGLDEPSDYEIGRQDLLEIKVFDVQELSQTVRVADDGSITMPLLGRLVVAGLTRTALERHVAELLETRFVHDPQVSVFVKEYESKKVAVSGAVRSPGSYEMLGRKTLLEMLSVADGLDRDRGREIVIFRRDAAAVTRRIAVDLDRLVYGADPALNVRVEPGDIIYVPNVEKVRIFVSGAVKSPDLYEVPREEPVTVLRAITLAGGTTDRAALKRVQIMRTDEAGERVTLYVNLKAVKRGRSVDPVLQGDDVVLVPESFF